MKNAVHYNCLIVDDETELAKMTAEYFNMFDVSTVCVSGASECYDFLKENTGIRCIFYGHDLHYLRLLREYELTGEIRKKREGGISRISRKRQQRHTTTVLKEGDKAV